MARNSAQSYDEHQDETSSDSGEELIDGDAPSAKSRCRTLVRSPWAWLLLVGCAGGAAAAWLVNRHAGGTTAVGGAAPTASAAPVASALNAPVGSEWNHLPPSKPGGLDCVASWRTEASVSEPAYTCMRDFPTCVGFEQGEQWGRCVRTCTASHSALIGDPAEVGGGTVQSYDDLCPADYPVCGRSGTCAACRQLASQEDCSSKLCTWQMGECMSLPWDLRRVAGMCVDAEESTWRRLGAHEDGEEEDEEEDDEPEAVPRRRLRPPAKFNPKFLSRIEVGPGASMTYYGSADIIDDAPICAKTAVMIIHGTKRNAQDYVCSVKKVVEASGLPKNETILVVPKFTYAVDERRYHDLWWNGSEPYGFWHIGGSSDIRSGMQMSSFEVLDRIILYLSNEKYFPCLKHIAVIGHSAGGQTVLRYSLTTRLLPANEATQQTYVDGDSVRPGVHLNYYLSDPSTYIYFDGNRWSYDCATPENPEGCTEPAYSMYSILLGRAMWKSKKSNPKGEPVPGGFNNPDYAPWTPATPFLCKSKTFNDYPHGLNTANSCLPYLRDIDWTKQMERYPFRNIFFLIGQNDTCTDDNLPFCFASCWRREQNCFRHNMDMECGGMLQGVNRYQRGLNFMRHLFNYYGKQVHRMFIIPGAGHQAEKMLITAATLAKTRVGREHEVHVDATGVCIGEQCARGGPPSFA